MVTSVSKSNEYLFHDCGYSVICCISYRFVVVELRIFFLLTDVMHHFYILTVPDCELIGLECAIVRVFVLPAPKLKSSFGRLKYWSWKYKKNNNFCELRIQNSEGKSMCFPMDRWETEELLSIHCVVSCHYLNFHLRLQVWKDTHNE